MEVKYGQRSSPHNAIIGLNGGLNSAGAYANGVWFGMWSSSSVLRVYENSSTLLNQSASNSSRDIWYKYRIRLDHTNNQIQFEWINLNTNTTIKSYIYNGQVSFSIYNIVFLMFGYYTNNYAYIRKISVKPL